ncbi:hypothetical protein FACS1894201_09310 [Bacteroidia bacterium]|nr:hypothetical protein FACS1894201_09310 [Bacteroidia bacterium]
MNIAVILPSLKNKAPIRVARNIIAHIMEEVKQVDVYYFDEQTELTFPCSTCRINPSQPIDFHGYDIIHSHGYRPDKYVWKFRKHIQGKTVSTVHSDVFTDLKYTYNVLISAVFSRLWIHFLKNKDCVVTLSHFLVDKVYKNYISEDKLVCIYNGVDEHKVQPIAEEDSEQLKVLKERPLKIIGTCAVLTKIKGLEQVINVLPQLPDYAFVVIGDGKQRDYLQHLARQQGVADRCVFLGYRSNARDYLPFFDVYVMPSYSEGMGLALIEAALAERPCVCSDIATFRELFSSEQVCFFALSNSNALSTAIETAYQQRLVKGHIARQYALQNYTSQRMADSYLQRYQALL